MAVLSFIKKALPWLGTAAGLAASAIPGAAPVVGIATKLLTTALSKPVTASNLTSVLTEALGDPAQLATLKQAEMDYQKAMEQMGYQHETEMEDIAAKDRESARALQASTKSWIPPVLSIVVVVLCISMEGWYSWAILHGAHFTSDGGVMLGRIMGTLENALILVLSYWFGSSVGSDRKTELLAQNGK